MTGPITGTSTPLRFLPGQLGSSWADAALASAGWLDVPDAPVGRRSGLAVIEVPALADRAHCRGVWGIGLAVTSQLRGRAGKVLRHDYAAWMLAAGHSSTACRTCW